MNKWSMAAILIAGLSLGAGAQTLTLALFQSSTDNLFQTSLPEKDQLSNMSFAFDQSFSPFSFFTRGNYSYLYNNTSLSDYAQEAGLDYVRAISEKTALYLAAKAEGTIYRETYADFNFLSLGLAAAAKSYLNEGSILKLNYDLDYKNYRLSIFDSISHYVTASLDRYFKTKTTLRADLNWGWKTFFHPYAAEPSMTGDPAVASGGSLGQGNGHRGPRWGFPRPGSGDQSQGIQIASLSGLVAQGIGDNVGLRISGLRQWTLSGENPFNSIEEFYLIENPSYDIFSWNGYGVTGQITVEAPWDIQMKMVYTGSWKEFPGIDARDMEGASLGVLRQDTRNQWEARLEKNFRALSVYVNYAYTDNRSNDPLFDWRGHFLTAGVEWNFFWGAKE
jgi:hypothetical protein